jgi:prepilin-type N-terminal cleavage/methylation domain-containing protein
MTTKYLKILGGRSAFTLIELLVVIVTLAVLAVLILPVLAKSGDNGARMVCLNNLRQLGTALNQYTGENQDYMPWPNWGNDASPPCPAGWLYKGDCAGIPLTTLAGGYNPGIVQNWPVNRVVHVSKGVFWPYLLNGNVFICPSDLKPAAAPSLWAKRFNTLSTYIMNGSACFFPPDGRNNTYGYATCKESQIWSPLCILLWEPDQNIDVGCYNDGASYPGPEQGSSASEGMANLHVTGGNVLTVSGGAQCMTVAAYTNECSIPGKNRLFWNPNTSDSR